jgi:sugar/nucleoside kinase (ribokinase family)
MIVVAGHLCLDIFPELKSGTELRPGSLVEAGRAKLSAGGAVPNVGLALDRLGAPVRLVGKVGNDQFGKIVLDILGATELENNIQIDRRNDTSYTIVVSPPGFDRTFLHCPGCNDKFVESDVPDAVLSGAKHLHFGYPPLMATMSANYGSELFTLLERAKKKGLTTSLDMSLPDPDSASGKLDWNRILRNVLPLVDMFLPSEDELAFMLPGVSGAEALARTCAEMGAGVVVVKRGDMGLMGLKNGNILEVPCFPSNVMGTTGSGDATIAGFLYGISHGFTFKESLVAGCAVGACSVETSDAVSGIPKWEDIRVRFKLDR